MAEQCQVITLETLLEERAELRQTLDNVIHHLRRITDQNGQLLVENARLREENAGLRTRVSELEKQVVVAQREAKRQAAPFRRKQRIPEDQHKKPGRKKGHEPAWRKPPDKVDRVVEVPLECCPDCGGALDDLRWHDHHVTDVPPPPPPTTTKYRTQSGRCPKCKAHRSSGHPDLPNVAAGAAGTMLGHEVVALAAQMRIQFGASFCKIAAFLSSWLKFKVTASGLLGALERTSTALWPTRKAIQLALQHSEAVHADETGWRLLCASAWAWVFTTTTHTLYVIRPSRGHEIVLEILGPEFAGFLVTDCMAAYNVLYPAEKKPKCASHFLKDLKEAEGLLLLPPGQSEARWPREVINLLKGAIGLKKTKPELAPEDFRERRQAIHDKLDLLLAEELTDPKSLTMAKRLRKHRAGVLLFLDHDAVEPTNNQAERQIRPFVIHRKLSGGNRSERGAAALATLASVFATTCLQGLSFTATVLMALRNRGQSALGP